MTALQSATIRLLFVPRPVNYYIQERVRICRKSVIGIGGDHHRCASPANLGLAGAWRKWDPRCGIAYSRVYRSAVIRTVEDSIDVPISYDALESEDETEEAAVSGRAGFEALLLVSEHVVVLRTESTSQPQPEA